MCYLSSGMESHRRQGRIQWCLTQLIELVWHDIVLATQERRVLLLNQLAIALVEGRIRGVSFWIGKVKLGQFPRKCQVLIIGQFILI